MSKRTEFKTLFLGKVRGRLYTFLNSGILKDYQTSYIYEIADAIIAEDMKEIDNYLKFHAVTLFTMDEHAKKIVDTVLVPYLKKRKVE